MATLKSVFNRLIAENIHTHCTVWFRFQYFHTHILQTNENTNYTTMQQVDYKKGDYVICVKDHSTKRVRKGEIYIMRDVARNPCCGTVIAYVGFQSNFKRTACYQCQFSYDIPDGKHWMAGYLFRKLDNPPISQELIAEIEERLELHELGIEKDERVLEPHAQTCHCTHQTHLEDDE